MSWIDLYVILGLSWSAVAVVRHGQKLGKVVRGESVNYDHLPAKRAEDRRERDARMKKNFHDLIELGVPVSVMAAVTAIVIVPIALVFAMTWPLPVARQLQRARWKQVG